MIAKGRRSPTSRTIAFCLLPWFFLVCFFLIWLENRESCSSPSTASHRTDVASTARRFCFVWLPWPWSYTHGSRIHGSHAMWRADPRAAARSAHLSPVHRRKAAVGETTRQRQDALCPRGVTDTASFVFLFSFQPKQRCA